MQDDGIAIELFDRLDGARLSGELDLLAYDEAAAALAPLFEADGDVRLDVSDLSFVDSSGIRLFVRLQHALEGRGTVQITGAQPHVERVLLIAGLPELGIRVGAS